jgi:hypothetical protein
MKKIVILILAGLAFSWTPVVSAEQSPESLVTCGAGLGNGLSMLSLPDTISTEECPGWEGGHCASCIISLENQGCKVIDVVVTQFQPSDGGVIVAGTTYLLSCVKP